ncbi:hypothetical protein LSAT2_005627 [Lamellibrachia satsuma]|nr:hypothetical protein LSAT2_005627 [Lamellibrachia satsuma]
MLILAIAMLLCLTAATVSGSGEPTFKCMRCMCEVYGCKDWKHGRGQGYFRITWRYWKDAGKPAYKNCVHDMSCSQHAIVAYMGRYVTNPKNQNCERFARVHRSGPRRWWSWVAKRFWKKVEICCDNPNIMPGDSC